MAKVAETLKNLSVENGASLKHDEKRTTKRRSEFSLLIEETASLNHSYVLAVCGTQSNSEFRIGTGLSDYTCVIYTVGENISQTVSLTHGQAPIVDIKFSPTSRNVFYTATSDGQITACDLRAKGKVVAEFKDSTEEGKMKPLASFDISCDEKLIAGGTEHIGGDVFILFWDVRQSSIKVNGKSSLLGGYWESHMEDVVSLTFHPKKSDVLASGSTDGLINVFDLTQPAEDLALTYSLNTESSVDRVGWLTDDSLWCTTQSSSLQLWNCDDAMPYARFERNSLAMSQNDDPDDCYLVRFHSTNSLEQPFILAGSSTVKGESLRCLHVVNDRLEMGHEIVGNKQIVRDSWLHEKSGCLVTGGESGIINVWRQTETTDLIPLQQNSGHKLMAKIGGGKGRDRQHRTKPY